jgi:hypothetical protein
VVVDELRLKIAEIDGFGGVRWARNGARENAGEACNDTYSVAGGILAATQDEHGNLPGLSDERRMTAENDMERCSGPQPECSAARRQVPGSWATTTPYI